MPRAPSRPLTHLCQIIERHARAIGLTNDEVARKIGLSSSYYGQIRTDPGVQIGLSRSVIEAIARFLNEPVAQVQLWAGQMKWEDFGRPANPSATVDQYLDVVALHIQDDPLMRRFGVNVKDWASTPRSIKANYVALYELARAQAVGERVFEGSPALTYLRAGKIEDASNGPALAAPARKRVK